MSTLRRTLPVLGSALVMLAAAAPASASQMIAAGAHNIHLLVNSRRIAQITYTKDGRVTHVLAWDAINARSPSESVAQVRFRLDYSGGSASFGNGYWRIMHNYCKPYTGPRLPYMFRGCDAPDGSYWALQLWRRELPDGGWRGNVRQEELELHLSHWSGTLPVLFGDTTWLEQGRFDRVFGYLKYRGIGVYGFRASSLGNPLDSYGRNVTLDTYDPAWGRGWYRFNTALLHRAQGNFCFGLFASFGRRLPARGQEYRLSVMGPGVTPIVNWKGAAPGRYNPQTDAARYAELKTFTPVGDSCRHN